MSARLSNKIARTVAGLLLATTAACSSSAAKSQSTTAASVDSTTASSTAEHAALGTGQIAGEPFTSTVQFVQFDQLGNAWRLHILDGEHTCADDLAALRPSVGIDFVQPTEVAATPPQIGTTTEGIGVTFRPTDPDVGFGPLTTTAGVTLTIERDDLDVGGRWSGHLTVEAFDQDDLTYGFDGPIDAEVCPAATL